MPSHAIVEMTYGVGGIGIQVCLTANDLSDLTPEDELMPVGEKHRNLVARIMRHVEDQRPMLLEIVSDQGDLVTCSSYTITSAWRFNRLG